MDSRHYDGVRRVAPGQFTAPQRQRLEAFTAAVGLLGRDWQLVDDLIDVAAFVADGSKPQADA